MPARHRGIVRLTVMAVALAGIVLSGCSSGPTAAPTSSPSAVHPGGTTISDSTAGSIDVGTPSSTAPRATTEVTTTDPTTTEPTTAAGPTSYQPPPDGQPVDGDCPFLTGQQVADDTGQRIGQPQIIPGEPQPVCVFIRSDGGQLATVRALSFASAAEAAGAVDFYLPRDQSSLETKPDGWAGGSMRTADGSVYGVSKDGYAVIATSNVMTVAARRLVVDAIANLGW